MGYQLFSARDALAENAVETLRALGEMGYRHYEGHGYDDATDRMYGLAPTELQQHLTEMGTPMTSAHFGFANYLTESDDVLRAYTDRCLSAAEALSLEYLVWPIIPEEFRDREGFERLASRLNVIGEHLRGSGRQFAFHNNGGEFLPLDADGASGYDIVVAETDAADVKLQLDMYWLAYDRGSSPAELIARNPERFVMWHVKDMHPVSRDYTELGAGSIDYTKKIPAINPAGLQHLYLEQGGNFTETSMMSAEQSAQHWKGELASLVG